MNSHTPFDGNPPFPNEIDLSDIFIGREQQLDQFRFYLERWQRLAATTGNPDLKAPPSPNDKIAGFVALLHGRGGFGKSTLLKRYREIALEYSDTIQVSDLIDWEFAAQERRALFNPAQREAIDASQYFSFMRDQLALALGRPRTDFKEYQVAVRAVDKAKEQAQGVLKGLQQDNRYAWLRSLPGEVVLALMQSVPVVKNLPLLKDDAITKAISDATNVGVTIGVEQIAQVWATLHERLGDDFSDYLNAPWRLGRAIGHDLAQLARRRPILIFFDTYEEIDEGDKLLQMIMGAAGGRVGWVIAGRDNLWAGVGQRRRSLEVEYGYRDLVLPDRRMVIDFSADGVGDFTSSDIEEYFTQLSRKALRPALPAVSEKDAVHIRDVTGGVPLAVKIAAGLYLESQNLALITESLDGKREIVDQMVERYLLHTRTNPADRSRLYGLALLRRPDEQRALAAALDVPDNYDAELARLHRRYGFIFTKQEQPALHQEVRYFLRLWLLQHRTSSPEIMRVISRLREALFTSFQELEAQRHYASLRQHLEDEQWVALYLDLTEQQFWLDPAEGVAYVLPFMFAASVYQREANRVARTIGEFFQATLVQPYRKQWDWANQSLVYSTSHNPLPEELSGLKDVVRLASQNKVAFFPPMPPFQEELEAAVWWRLGEAYRGKSLGKCVYWYEKVLGRLPHEEDLREALAEAKLDREHAATEEEADEDDLLQQTAPTLPGGTPHTHDGSAGGTTTSDSQRTMAELDRALERDPKSVHAYAQRGDAYAARKEYRRAIADFDRALELALQDAALYTRRGEAYLLLREYRQAIADFDRALELAPQDASLCARRGEAYLLLREYRRALVDFDRTLELEPDNETIRTKRNEASLELTRTQQASVPAPQRAIRPLHISRRTFLGLGLGVTTGGLIIGGSLWLLSHRPSSSNLLPPPLPLPHSYLGHTDAVNSVAWSPDGKRLASASDDQTVRVWDASSGQTLLTYKGHTSFVNSAAWSPDGKRLASASDDQTVRVWNASSGQTLLTYKGHTDRVEGVAWSPDGKRLASTSWDKTVQVWEASNGQTLLTYKEHIAIVNSAAWSPDGKRLVSASGDKTVQVWEASNGQTLLTYKGHTDRVEGVAWSPDGKRLASASWDKTVQVWEASNGQTLLTYTGHTAVVRSVAWSPDGKRLASASDDRTVQVWDASSGQTLLTYIGHTGPVLSVAWSPDGTRLASAGLDKTVRVWLWIAS